MTSERGAGSLFRRGRIWWLKYYRSGRPFRESSKSEDERVARKLLNRRLGQIADGRFVSPRAERITWDELAKDYRTLLEIERRFTPTADNNLRHLASFFAGWRAHRITEADLRTYIERRQKEGAANATINRELAAMRRAFYLGIRAEKVARKPSFPMLREKNTRKGFFDRDAFEAIRRQLPEVLADIATFSYWTGWRRGDIVGLEWRQVDMEHRSVRIDPGVTKGGEGRLVFLPSEAFGVVEKWHAKRKVRTGGSTKIARWVFHYDGGKVGPFNQTFARAARRAGLPGMIFHDLRRTAVRNLVRAGVPDSVAMKITGHRTRSVFDRYNIVSEGDLKRAAKLLNGHKDGHNSEGEQKKGS